MSRLTAIRSVSLRVASARNGWLARVSDYIELTKPRIVVLELVTVVVAAHLASPWGIQPLVLLHTVLGAALVAASAGAFNQWWEQAADSRMVRTASRPLPTGRLSATQVVVFGSITLFAGTVELILGVSLTTAAFALATWLVYVLAY